MRHDVNPTLGRELALQLPDMHVTDTIRDLAYTAPDGRGLGLDIHRPKQRGASALPAVLLGGPPAFHAGRSSGQKIGWAQAIAASGMAAVPFDTRSDDFLKSSAAPCADVEAAIAFVREHGREHGLDPDRLATLGFSIGTAPWHLWAVLREPLPFVRCNVVYYGPLDFDGAPLPAAADLDPEYAALTHLRRHRGGIPPMLIARAGQESFTFINDSIERFTREAAGLGAPVELIEHESGPHGFDIRLHDARSAEIIRSTLAFLRRHLEATPV